MPGLTPASRAFLQALTRGGAAGFMVDELAERLKVSEAAIRARASRLHELGLIEVSHAEGFAFYKLTAEGRRAR